MIPHLLQHFDQAIANIETGWAQPQKRIIFVGRFLPLTLAGKYGGQLFARINETWFQLDCSRRNSLKARCDFPFFNRMPPRL